MQELLTEVPVETKEILVEKQTPSDCPCDADDKECQRRWIQANTDCD